MKLALSISLALTAAATAASLNSAELTQVVKDVKVYRGKAAGKTATVGDKIDGSTSVTTGRRSRAELTFQDKTITRLGQNSIFSFRQGSRDVELKRGTILLQVPKNAGGATIRTATVTAAITGTTSMMEYSPGEWVKLITLEGTQKLYIKGNNKPVDVPAGHMIVMRPDAKQLPRPIPIDLSKLLATSKLADRKVFGELPRRALAAIDTTVDGQRLAKRTGEIEPNRDIITSTEPRIKSSSTGPVIRTVSRSLYQRRLGGFVSGP